VNSRFVRKGILTDDRFVALYEHSRDARNQATCAAKLGGVDTGLDTVVVLTSLERHDNFFEGRVSRTLAQPVDRAFDLSRSCFDCRETVRNGQTEIVMAMRADDRLMDIRNVLFEM
jgi:hypothetical protein